MLTNKDTKQILTEEEALESKEPINISVGFVIWSNIDPGLTTLLRKISGSDGDANELISLSLELQFTEFNIYKGVSKNMFEGELITEDEKVETLYQKLRDFDGPGIDDDGTPLYLIASGEDLNPLGCGLVTSPAADVKGISSKVKEEDSEKDDEENEHEEDCECKDCMKDKEMASLVAQVNKLVTEIDNLKISGSQLKNSDVKMTRMKITKTSDITDENLGEIKACEIVDFITNELGQKSSEYQTVVEAKTKEVEDAQEAARLANEQLASVNENLTQLTNELNSIKEARAAEALEASFNDRMSALDEEFELDDKAREIVAVQIKGLSDEDYEGWKKGFDVLAADKNKEVIKAKTEAIKNPKKIEASENNGDEIDPLEALKAKASALPSSTAISEDLVAQYKDAFSLEKGFTVEA